MQGRATEGLHDAAAGLDQRPRAEVAALLADGQIAAAGAVRAALPQIVAGAGAMAASIARGARLHYVAAGSSGLMAAADAQELGGTFSIPADRLRIHMAGGLPTGVEMPGGTEDDTESLGAALADLDADDTVIAVSASGTTPYTVAAVDIAREKGATVIGIANNADAPLLRKAHHAILLPTPAEVLSGSTRMGAGTAQKIALNMLSTLMAVELGHIHDGLMVNLRADNIKLRARAAGIVAQIARVEMAAAEAALDAADGVVKPATLIAAGGISPAEAAELLTQTHGNLRAALQRLG